MAVQLILKNSTVEDRRPTAAQLANGELSINFNEAGPFLCCKDTAGNIQQLGGIKFNPDVPADAVTGTWWYNTATETLYVWDGIVWKEIGGSGGGGGSGITQILADDGIDATVAGTVVTLNVDIDPNKGLYFDLDKLAINPGANISFDADGKIQADIDTLSYKGTIDLTSDPVPAGGSPGDAFVNTAAGAMSAAWQIATGLGATTVSAGDLVIKSPTAWSYIPTGGVDVQTDLGIDNRGTETLDITSSTGTDATIPAATDALAGLMTAADKIIIDEGASTWERNGSILHPVDDAYDVRIGGTLPSAPNITLNADGSITAAADASIHGVTVGLGNSSVSTNTAVGNGALFKNTTGSQNTAIGQRTLNNNTEGSYNVAVGYTAVLNNTTGSSNTVVGREAFYNNTIGSFNTVVGRNALMANSTGDNNTAIGFQSLLYNTEGDSNAALGHYALYNNITGSFNTALGKNAGFHIEGSNNTILGPYQGSTADATLSDTVIISAGASEKLRIDSTGSLLFGGTLPSAPNITLKADGSSIFALDATIHGVTVGLGGGSLSTNTAVGLNALQDNTTGDYNTAVGRNALANTTSPGNTALGYYALSANTAGNSNTAVGWNALYSNTTGPLNTAVGREALYLNTIGTQNTAVGRSALKVNTEGDYNTAVGLSALFSNTEGDNNTVVGLNALYNNITGSFNTALGRSAGFHIEGSNNTVLGAYEGTVADATLSDTVIISAGTTERARCDSSGTWQFPSDVTLAGDLYIAGDIINTVTDGDQDIICDGSGLIEVTEYNLTPMEVVTKHDIGTAANEVPLNGFLGTLAYKDDLAITNGLAVADLPTSPTARIGNIARVTDGAAALTWGATVTGGGTAQYLVWYNGTNWTVFGA